MADVKPKSAKSPKVSPVRTVASLILLLVVGVVCAIELRAGFGQMMSGKSLAAKSNDGEFTDLSLEEARGMMSLAPKEIIENRGPDTYYHYEWYSFLRPLMGQTNPKLTIVATNEEKPMAMAFFASDEIDSIAKPAPSIDGTADSGVEASGMMGGGMGGPEMETGMGGRPDTGGGKSERPPMEDEPESSDSPSPAETPAAAENSVPAEAPASETPAGDAPVPSSAAPAAEEPAPAK